MKKYINHKSEKNNGEINYAKKLKRYERRAKNILKSTNNNPTVQNLKTVLDVINFQKMSKYG